MNSTPDGIDGELWAALKPDEDYWKVGDPSVVVTTRSGSKYHVLSDGSLSGKMKGGTVDFVGKLTGAVYRGGGPIRVNQIVYGMGVEFVAEGKVYTSSTVVEVKDA